MWRMEAESITSGPSSRPKSPSKILLGIETLTHPAASPDLNPIENMWAIMKNGLRKRKTSATSKEELWKRIQEEWDAIPITTVDLIIESMEPTQASRH